MFSNYGTGGDGGFVFDDSTRGANGVLVITTYK
jgi:hypothetical protein